jgi:hypothetical protein
LVPALQSPQIGKQRVEEQSMIINTRRLTWIWAGLACLAIATTLAASAQKDDKDEKDKEDAKRPKLLLRAQPNVGLSPVRARFTAELIGGANDYEEFYCPSIEWDWGDGTRSQSSFDCQPYEPGKSEIRRHFTIEHLFRAGHYHVVFRIKRTDKTTASVTTDVSVQAGLGESGQEPFGRSPGRR